MLNWRSMIEAFPPRSFTRITIRPSDTLVRAALRGRVHTSGSVSINMGPSSEPAGLPFTSKFAWTEREAVSRPEAEFRIVKEMDGSGPALAPARGEDRLSLSETSSAAPTPSGSSSPAIHHFMGFSPFCVVRKSSVNWGFALTLGVRLNRQSGQGHRVRRFRRAREALQSRYDTPARVLAGFREYTGCAAAASRPPT